MNNFACNVLDFTGREIGIQQSIREIPGFLSFAAVFLAGAGNAVISLFLARILPTEPSQSVENIWKEQRVLS